MRYSIPISAVLALRVLAAEGTARADTFTYDGAGRLASSVRGGVTTTYHYDGENMLTSVCRASACEEIVTASGYVVGEVGSSTRVSAYAPGRQVSRRAGAGAPSYLLTDEPGTVLGEVGASGTILSRAAWDVYGTARVRSSGQTGPGFHGEYGSDDGSVWLRARTYRPEDGRFLSRDPVGGKGDRSQSLNRYTFVENRPTVARDPSGNEAELIIYGSPTDGMHRIVVVREGGRATVARGVDFLQDGRITLQDEFLPTLGVRPGMVSDGDPGGPRIARDGSLTDLGVEAGYKVRSRDVFPDGDALIRRVNDATQALEGKPYTLPGNLQSFDPLARRMFHGDPAIPADWSPGGLVGRNCWTFACLSRGRPDWMPRLGRGLKRVPWGSALDGLGAYYAVGQASARQKECRGDAWGQVAPLMTFLGGPAAYWAGGPWSAASYGLGVGSYGVMDQIPPEGWAAVKAAGGMSRAVTGF